MSEYPEDIMKAAQKAIDHMPDLKAMMDPSEFWEVAEEAVAAAILAERERCAEVARQRFTEANVLKNAKGKPYTSGSAAIVAGHYIAEAILKGGAA